MRLRSSRRTAVRVFALPKLRHEGVTYSSPGTMRIWLCCEHVNAFIMSRQHVLPFIVSNQAVQLLPSLSLLSMLGVKLKCQPILKARGLPFKVSAAILLGDIVILTSIVLLSGLVISNRGKLIPLVVAEAASATHMAADYPRGAIIK